MITDKLLNEYRRSRAQHGYSPAKALADARNAIASGRAVSFGITSFLPCLTIGAPFKLGADMCRWIERPADYGLRFVGNADDIAPRTVRHTGWYCSDDNWTGEKARGCVWQLPARNGRPQFVAALSTTDNDEGVIVAFDITDDEATAAIWADGLAENYADNSRDYQRVYSARVRYDELADDISALRKDCLALIRELKPRLRSFGPAMCRALRHAVASQLETIRRARQERADILHAFGSHAAWEG
ncbi:hypothetical protein [Bradyrhizobium sp. SZCCHNR2009]|uniref:hypothetical protein n=1 Tax=Bradyrhizobium sp. SZCCHNR2009 TaxID=3057375 RepID=UPI0028E59902|nr:hypothetical protein [Bradyrhizobium sp. SZCCHNR2009]